MTGLANLLVNGFNPSISGADDINQWGARTLREGTPNQLSGVYTFSFDRDPPPWDEKVGNGYSTWCDVFGDRAYFSVYYVLYANYNARVTPTIRKQLVFPADQVFIKEIRICVRPYHTLPHESTVIPVWLPVLEVPFMTRAETRPKKTRAPKPRGTVATRGTGI